MATNEYMKKQYLKYKGNHKLTRAKAIRLYCRYICCANETTSWRDCQCKYCFLWNFRMGKELHHKNSKVIKNPPKTEVFEAKTITTEQDGGETNSLPEPVKEVD